jgi:ABC-type phosphate/phosphonate transport system substrate-binding protein
MSQFIAALPMYDWAEVRAEVDAEWARLRGLLRKADIDAPERLVRRNADMPAVLGGIRDAVGKMIAPDSATLPPDEFDAHVLWRHPKLLFAQTCWGPMGEGLAEHVVVVGQPDYSAFEGGQGELYSSAILMRREGKSPPSVLSAPTNGNPLVPIDRLRGRRFAYNSADSMSGIIALTHDLEALGKELGVFSERLETGGHRNSIIAVAEGRADVCAIDCRSWAMARRFEPAAKKLAVVGWTARRKGLPYITARTTSPEAVTAIRNALVALAMTAAAL